ncbi:MAG: hypothetical protein MUD06_00510 [Rhodospirillales bacterium]|jgi:hypothetical protein|nr:hypothetical protein [Rhodospirillales bacterium]
MARVRSVKTNFSAGEVSPRLLGRTDLRAFENGAARLRNVFIHPTGGVSRRPGLRFVDTARGSGRLIPAEFQSDEVYLLVLTNRMADVYSKGVRVAGFSTPWSAEQLTQANWVQSPDALLVVHPETPPQQIVRRGASDWTMATWTFSKRDGRVCAPHHKFVDEQVTLKAAGTTGIVTVTASALVFKAGHVGVRFRIADREVVVTEVVSETQARVDVKQTLAGTQATEDWSEEAFSTVRGWPTAVCYHQDRLVIGGSRDLANRLWMSRTSQPFDFDLGDGLDDQAIEFSILSDQLNAIRAVFSGRHLQVFTSGAEWMVSGDPLTPTNIQLHRQTRVGSIVTRTVAPKDIDGATVFVGRSQKQIREFLFTDTEQAYQANDLSLLADHLIDRPVDMDLDQASRLLHVVLANGTMATLTIYRNEQISAWTLQETPGAFRSVAAVGDDTYVLVERVGGNFIEVFDDRLSVDAGRVAAAASPQSSWGGLDHLDGQRVKVTADGAVQPDATVSGGSVELDVAARTCTIGLGYTHVVEPLPVVAPGSGMSGVGTRLRPVAVTLRLLETAALYLDTGRGLVDVPFRRFRSGSLEAETNRFTGDVTVRAYGWRADASSGLWRIVQSAPLPFTLLSVATEVSAS